MKAVVFSFSIPRYAPTLALGPILPSSYYGPFSCVQFSDVPDPHPLTDHWVKVKTRYGGICGSDVGLVRLHDSPASSPPLGYGSDAPGEGCLRCWAPARSSSWG